MTAGLITFTNNATTTLAGSIASGATSVNLAAGNGARFPNPAAGQYFQLTFTDQATGLLNEVVSCTARSGDTLTIVRAQEGTTALSWLANDIASLYWTAGSAALMVQAAQLQIQPGNYAPDTGSVNALACTLSTVPASYAALIGAPIRVKVANTNTGAATLNVNGLGAVAIYTASGAAISSGQLVAGGICEFVYDGTHFQLISWSGLSASGVGVGSYTFSNITVGATGLVTAASSGVLTSGMVTTALGFTPARQGSYAPNPGNNIVSFGWNGGFLWCAIDSNTTAVGAVASTNWVSGNFATNSWVNTYFLPKTNPSVTGTLTASAAVNSSGTIYAAGAINAGGTIAGATVQANAGNVTAYNGRLRASYGAWGTGDGNCATILNDFVVNSSQAIFPNGFRFIWGAVSATINAGPQLWNFPVAFPSAAAGIIGSIGAFSPPPTASCGFQVQSNSQFYTNVAASTGGSLGLWYLAWGW
jgi:hypothetical protein